MRNGPNVNPAVPLPAPQAHKTGLQLLSGKLAQVYQAITSTELLRTQTLPFSALQLQGRLELALGYYERRLAALIMWLHCSLEETNFTYDLTERNRRHLAHFVAAVVGRPAAQIAGYLRELQSDDTLRAHYSREIQPYGRLTALEWRLQVGRRA